MDKHMFLWIAVLCSVIISTSAHAINIVNKGWRDEPTTTYFNPSNPPYGLDSDEGITIPRVYITGGIISGKYKNGCLKVTEMTDITIQGRSDIYEPTPPDSDLHDHELGHDELNRFEFERNANKKLRAAMDGFEDMNFCAPDSDQALEMAVAERNRRFEQAKYNLKKQMQVLSDKYDSKDFTNHNENESVTPAEAVEAVKAGKDKIVKKKEQLRAGPAQVPAAPPRIDPILLVSDPAAFRRIQAMNAGAIMFDPVVPNLNPANPGDTLHNRLKVILDELERLGKLPSKKEGFTDKTVKFVDTMDPNMVYLQGAIFEITYEPSNRPGFDYMLHGVFDIWPGEINNAIGSDWLAAMHDAAIHERDCGFWMYFNAPLFDAAGGFIVDPAPVPCEIAFGAAILDQIQVKEDFEGYIDSAQLLSSWQTTPGAMVMLNSNAADGRQSMLLEYNTITEPFAEATQIYPSPQNWLASGKSHFELWFNTDGFDPNAVDNLYVKVQGGGMNGVCYLGMGNPFVHFERAEAGYAAAAIGLDVFMASGVNLSMVEAVTIGVNRDPLTGGAASAVRIDAMRLSRGEFPAAPTADLDEDYKVNLSDLAILAAQWLDGI